ncbi:hypothetical protein HU200_053909 [Digitaria exilis]|uniref:VWFA domain-containing protein n=1 Tax=Digitaria exilis TaxID=1010633 RepID=A0A835E2Y7_9POAL|nr:hypothetical protein HU200_053909 [Digitaria exilis]
MQQVHVVLVFAFDVNTLSENNRTDNKIFDFMTTLLSNLSVDNRHGYINYRSPKNTYMHGMPVVKKDGPWPTDNCTTKMACGLPRAHELIGQDDLSNAIILLFSDGKIYTGGFFEGGEDYKSQVPVHTFTLGGDGNNSALRTIAGNSPGGEFHTIPAPDNTFLSERLKQELESIVTNAAAMNKKQHEAPVNDKEADDLEVLVRVEAPKPPQAVAIKHPPIDLVAVVDVSTSMSWLPDQDKEPVNGKKSRMEYLKEALKFIIDQLRDDDRLSIVQFNEGVKASTALMPMSGNGRKSAREVAKSLIPGGGTIFRPALEKAARILQDRDKDNTSIRVPFIVFLSDGEENQDSKNKTQWDQVISPDSKHSIRDVLQKYPVHTFGFSGFHDSMALWAIARVSGGTYSYVDQGLDNITDAFAVCLGGLSTVVAKNTTITLSVTAPGVKIVSIDAGGYDKAIKEGGASGEVRIPLLYEGEVKNFIVHLRVPRAEAAAGAQQVILTAGGTYVDTTADEHGASSTTTITISQDKQYQLCIQRPAGGDDSQQRDEAVLEQVTRFKLVSLLETELLPNGKELKREGGKWSQWLRKNWNELKNSSSGGLSSIFDKDVEVIAGKLEQGSGESFVFSYVSSQQMERATTMGSSGNTIAVDYKTPAVTKMAEKAAATKLPVEAPPAAPQNNGGGDVTANAKPYPAVAPANGGGDIAAGAKMPPPPPEETPSATDELDQIEQLLAGWSNAQRDLVKMSTLGHAQYTGGDQLLKTTFLNLSLQSFNQAMYQSVCQAVEQALHVKNCNGAATAVAASLLATAADSSSDNKEQARCKCVDLASIGQRLQIWSKLIHQHNQIKLGLPQDATEATHYLAAASLEPSMEAINRAMHHDIYLAVTQAIIKKRCYCAGKQQQAPEQQHGHGGHGAGAAAPPTCK